MRPSANLILAATILLVGVSLSLVFRKEPLADQTSVEPLEPLLRRGPASPVVMEIAPPIPRPEPPPAAAVDADAAGRAMVTELFARNPAAPRIAEHYPGPETEVAAGSSPTPPPSGVPVVDVAQPIEHKIVDGDSLARLAERYLGDPRRKLEIFEANRQVLSDPELLPIGAKLRIPPR